MTSSLNQYLQALSADEHLAAVSGIKRGVEREALRVVSEGRLSTQPHRESLGSALTHPYITTDYSETLLEFITPVSGSAEQTIAQLEDIQKYAYENIDGELLWPLSMPCFVEDDDQIPLAQYGSSNVGRMKTVYRQGLKNRYGSMMQVIAGIHFNFSFSEDFWRAIQQIDGDTRDLQTFVSERYFALIRNYKRLCWLIPYLFGSSPILCSSFLQDKPHQLPFKRSKTGYLYLEHATSLRMSDLGYTNSAQSALNICYNNLASYVEGVKEAISLASDDFDKIGVKVDGEYRQLNSNVLQIENELYAPIRPKRVAESGEKPSEALQRRGVEYIEVRALDVNPFSATGISLEQMRFLDVFLTYCALAPSPEMTAELQKRYEHNMDKVVLRGREPELKLNDDNQCKTIPEWGGELFEEFMQVAKLLDKAYGADDYQVVTSSEFAKVKDASLTPSAKLVDMVVNQEAKYTALALGKASEYREQQMANGYQTFDLEMLTQAAKQSHLDQKAIEENDTRDFDSFLADYFKA
ncbi:glutamate--cysteine ligase [Thalassotalea euphylliae]|uniref:Glutamate--cysteine ligase n=1 Tax=Thalassotalea euphylliae TaxID=1655234 RepID=A0A3E0UHB5_9GAMM|nr:glutamate--cysteine ligase [Thalassotalea euphylliae]REL36441.1 glutamate--cysteine ligase [Thalassotalea euphylliae]